MKLILRQVRKLSYNTSHDITHQFTLSVLFHIVTMNVSFHSLSMVSFVFPSLIYMCISQAVRSFILTQENSEKNVS